MKSCRILAFLLMFMLVGVPLIPVADAAEIMLFYTYTTSVSAGLTIDAGGSATATGNVVASKTSYSISGTIAIQQYKSGAWSSYKSWPTGTSTGKLNVSKTATLPAGYKYRTKLTVNVNGESITTYSSEKSC